MPEIGIIGGSGVYQIEGIEVIREELIDTPFGPTSDKIIIAKIENKEVAFLPRHGKGHSLSPSNLPVKANAWAFKKLGVRKVIAISAVGSLKEKIAPQHLVVPTQIIDRTKARPSTLFDGGVVGHITFADPFCLDLASTLHQVIKESGIVPVHTDETYICMEGPQFSTRAESKLYRSWGAGIIGMTALPEAKIFKEAEMCYAMVAMSTDYDCWHEEDVTVEMVMENMKTNVANIKKLLPSLISRVTSDSCACESAAQFACVTDLSLIPDETRKKLDIFYGKYWNR